MTSFVPALSLFAIPLLLSGVAQKHKGLITGLFIALYLLSRVHPLLSLVPLSCAAYLFMVTKHRIPKGKVRRKFRNPALPLFMVFLLTMGIFCAFGESVVGYGQTLRLPPRILSAGNSAVALACLIGPVAIGNRCDKKGPFFVAVLLTMLNAISVLLTAGGRMAHTFFILSMFSTYFCISGFFVLMPLLASVFFGEQAFRRIYPALALLLALLWQMFPPAERRNWNDFYQSGEFLVSLLCLSVFSAIFLYLSWKKRLSLITESA